LTHDVLYETYRTEKLSRTVHSDTQSVDPPSYQVLNFTNFLVPDPTEIPQSFLKNSLLRAFASRRNNSEKKKKRYAD